MHSVDMNLKRNETLHLIKGRLDDPLVLELSNRKNIITYYDSSSEFNASVPKHKPAIISCKKQEYNGKVIIAYDTGKCNIEAVLLNPYASILGVRKFDIECINTSDSTNTDTITNTKPIANEKENKPKKDTKLKK